MGELTVLGHARWSLVVEFSYGRHDLFVTFNQEKKNHSVILMSVPQSRGF